MGRWILVCLALALAGCGSNQRRPLPQASEAGRRACVEEVQANNPAQGRQLAMRRCLASIDQRLREQQRRRQEAQRAGTISPAGAPSPQSARQRFLHCRLHQSEIQAAESERQRRQSIWAVVSRQEAPGSISYNEARAAYEDSLNTLERLIPEAMRDGQPLIPDSIRRFMSCDFPEATAGARAY
jgi:hypothetical protein